VRGRDARHCGARAGCATEYAGRVEESRPSGNEAGATPKGAGASRGPVASTSCLVILLVAVFIVLIVLPMGLWFAGIVFGGS
jgi:hypothetical protein